MRDEIMRLANQMDEFVASRDKHDPLQHLPYWNGRHHERDQNADIIAGFSEKLRALARTDHAEDKLGMVPASRDRVSEIEDAVASGAMNAMQCFTQMRQLIVKPHHSAGVVGVVSDDAMIERAAKAVADDWQSRRLKKIPWEQLVHAQRELARAQARIVIAALAQPADADADGAK